MSILRTLFFGDWANLADINRARAEISVLRGEVERADARADAHREELLRLGGEVDALRHRLADLVEVPGSTGAVDPQAPGERPEPPRA